MENISRAFWQDSDTIMDIFEGSKSIVSHPGCWVRQGEQNIGATVIRLVRSLYAQETCQYDIQSRIYILETDAQVQYQNSKYLQACHALIPEEWY